MFFIQTLIFAAVAFALGCFFGSWLRGQLTSPRRHSGAAAAITHEGAARTSTAGELASSSPHYEPATSPQPAVVFTPKPAASAKPLAEAKPEPVAKPDLVAGAPIAAVAAVPAAPARKPAKPKAGKAAAAKAVAASAAPKPASSKASTVKVANTKPAAAKPKPAKAKPEAAAIPDNLKQIKGVGPQIEAKLNAAGINSFAQIAAWSKKEQADFAEQLSFAGRIEREEWVSQAKILAKGGSTEFAKRVAKGEVASSADNKSKRGGKK